jgi:hypothetical protein
MVPCFVKIPPLKIPWRKKRGKRKWGKGGREEIMEEPARMEET